MVFMRWFLYTHFIYCRAEGDHEKVSIRWYRDSFTSTIENGNPTKIVLNNQFNPTTYENDFALLRFEADYFPELNVIPFHFGAVADGLAASVAGFGLYHPDATGGIANPNVGELLVEACPAAGASPLVTTGTHMCASAPKVALCSGDNGAGIFATIDNERVLV